MNLEQLRSFVEVARLGNFTRAAEQLHLAQPSLSRQIAALEQDLGAELFHRARGGSTLTVAGESLLPLARRMLADAESVRRELAELAGLERGRVRLGATPTLCISLVAEVLSAFHAAHPAIELHLSEQGSRRLLDELAGGELDLALITTSDAVVGRALHGDAAARRGARGRSHPPLRRRSPPATPSDSRTSRACRRSSSARPTTCAARRMPRSARRVSRPRSCSRGRRWMPCCGSSNAGSASRSSRRWCSSIGPDCDRCDSPGRRSPARSASPAPRTSRRPRRSRSCSARSPPSATALAARAGATMRLAGASA